MPNLVNLSVLRLTALCGPLAWRCWLAVEDPWGSQQTPNAQVIVNAGPSNKSVNETPAVTLTAEAVGQSCLYFNLRMAA